MKSLFTLVFSTCLIIAHAQPGTIDKTYGMDNTGTVSILSQTYVEASAMQPDNKLLIGGTGAVYGLYNVLRHNQDGTIDTTFGKEGPVTITVDDLVENISYSNGWQSIAVEADGKMVAVGEIGWDNPDFHS